MSPLCRGSLVATTLGRSPFEVVAPRGGSGEIGVEGEIAIVVEIARHARTPQHGTFDRLGERGLRIEIGELEALPPGDDVGGELVAMGVEQQLLEAFLAEPP